VFVEKDGIGKSGMVEAVPHDCLRFIFACRPTVLVVRLGSIFGAIINRDGSNSVETEL
jgi:hypothetical protein